VVRARHDRGAVHRPSGRERGQAGIVPSRRETHAGRAGSPSRRAHSTFRSRRSDLEHRRPGAQTTMLQIVVFSIFPRAAILRDRPQGRSIEADRRAGAEVLFKMVGFVMRFAHFGVGAAIRRDVRRQRPARLAIAAPQGHRRALRRADRVLSSCCSRPLRLLTRVHMRTFLARSEKPALIAFTTAPPSRCRARCKAWSSSASRRRIVGFGGPTGYAFTSTARPCTVARPGCSWAQVGGVDMTWVRAAPAMLVLMVPRARAGRLFRAPRSSCCSA